MDTFSFTPTGTTQTLAVTYIGLGWPVANRQISRIATSLGRGGGVDA